MDRPLVVLVGVLLAVPAGAALALLGFALFLIGIAGSHGYGDVFLILGAMVLVVGAWVFAVRRVADRTRRRPAKQPPPA